MNILVLAAGGGGGNILRSVKTLFRNDLAIAQKTDAKYADRLRRTVTTRFLDTNEFSLSDVAPEERVLIGASERGRFGSRHDPQVARAALDESRAEVERLISRYAAVIIIATGGKGTGAGTIFPLAEIARQQRKLVIPIFVRPSFERHEVEKQRYDHALQITQQFDAAGIRLVEILNERGYDDSDPQPQSVVWERMNRPIARGLRGLLYVLSDLSQVDPSDLSTLFAGHGRLRMGFAEIDPPARQEPTDAQIEAAVRSCWDDTYYAFHGPVGTSLICLQGQWSNIVDAKIKSNLARLAVGESGDHPYNPLYARADRIPKPWGVSAIFTEYTGASAPLELDWSLSQRAFRPARVAAPAVAAERVSPDENPFADADAVAQGSTPDHESVAQGFSPARKSAAQGFSPAGGGAPERPIAQERSAAAGFTTLWEFAVALNRQEPAALATARNGADARIAVDGLEVKKLLTTVWFRSAFDSLSAAWRERLLDALVDAVVLPNHALKGRRGSTALRDIEYHELKELFSRTFVADAARPDVELLLSVGRLWGEGAVRRFRFADVAQTEGNPKFGGLLHGFRL